MMEEPIAEPECEGASSPRRQCLKKRGGIGVTHGDSQLIPVAGLPKIRIDTTKRRSLKEDGVIQASKVARGGRAALRWHSQTRPPSPRSNTSNPQRPTRLARPR